MTWKRNDVYRWVHAVKYGIIHAARKINLYRLLWHRALSGGSSQMSWRLHRLTSWESWHLVIKWGGQIHGVWADIGALFPEDKLLLYHLCTIKVLIIRRFEHLLINKPFKILLGIIDLDSFELWSCNTFGGQARLPIRKSISGSPMLVKHPHFLSGRFGSLISYMKQICCSLFIRLKIIVDVSNWSPCLFFKSTLRSGRLQSNLLLRGNAKFTETGASQIQLVSSRNLRRHWPMRSWLHFATLAAGRSTFGSGWQRIWV